MNIKVSRLSIYLICIILSNNILAQVSGSKSLFTLSDAVAIAMLQNQDILLARNNLHIADNNAKIFNSGYLPTITGGADGNYSNTDSHMTYSDSDPTNSNAVVVSSYGGLMGINYRLFDGMNRHFNFKILQKDYSLAELQSRGIIEDVLLSLSKSYYNVALLTKGIENIKRTLSISYLRYSYIMDKYKYGQSSELDLLNSEVDLNKDSINLINLQRELHIAQNNFTQLLGQVPGQIFNIDTSVVFNTIISKDSILASAKNYNVYYQQSLQNKKIQELSLKQSKSGYFPTIDVSGSYFMSKTNTPKASPLYLRDKGFNLGMLLAWNIFDGGSTRTKLLNAKTQIENADYLVQQSYIKLNCDIMNAYVNYNDLYYIMNTEKRNVKTNQLNFIRSAEHFKLGLISSHDFRKTQVDLQKAIDRYNLAMFSAKISELELLKLAGMFLEIM